MRKLIIIFLLLFGTHLLHAAELRTIEVNGISLNYYFCKSDKPVKGVLIFLHGSVRAYKGQTENTPVPLEKLIEYNPVFIQTCNDAGYDVIAPIVFNEFNWFEPKGDLYIEALLTQYKNQYTKHYLSGFSDGASGAYKYFYHYPSQFNGLLLFNGYPQFQNVYLDVDYSRVTNKNIVFVGQTADKTIPYEFMLTEFRRQKMTNEMTTFMLFEGKHQFINYTVNAFQLALNALEQQPTKDVNSMTDSVFVYPPMDAWMEQTTVKQVYVFRKKIGKNYGMSTFEFTANQAEHNKLQKLLKSGAIQILPIKVAKADITNPTFSFPYFQNGKEGTFIIQNYLIHKSWGN